MELIGGLLQGAEALVSLHGELLGPFPALTAGGSGIVMFLEIWRDSIPVQDPLRTVVADLATLFWQLPQLYAMMGMGGDLPRCADNAVQGPQVNG